MPRYRLAFATALCIVAAISKAQVHAYWSHSAPKWSGAVTSDPARNVFHTYSDGTSQILEKYNAQGVFQWSHPLDTVGPNAPERGKLIADSAGNVYGIATTDDGFANGNPAHSAVIFSYTAAGVKRWSITHAGSAVGDNTARDLQ